MKLSKRTIRMLSEMICGAHGSDGGFSWDNFVYRTSSGLTQFFTEDCELPFTHSGGTRITWVTEVLTELNEVESSKPELPSDNITRVVVALLESIKHEQKGTYTDAINDLNTALAESGLEIRCAEGTYTFIIHEQFSTTPKIVFTTNKGQTAETLFKQQFPVGLPFGWAAKPDFAILAAKDAQSLGFELKDGLWILHDHHDVYPNFSFLDLEKICNISHDCNTKLKVSLVNMNQTPCEKTLFKAYGKKFGMADSDEVPLLIPQAWIQWHSQPKKRLRKAKSAHADEPFRIDLVAFWNNQRYAILVDDIGHYARQNKDEIWVANEEKYSIHLKEERKLRKDGWHVFRISNWEIRHEHLLQEVLVTSQ
jgi:hypothetical protein